MELLNSLTFEEYQAFPDKVKNDYKTMFSILGNTQDVKLSKIIKGDLLIGLAQDFLNHYLNDNNFEGDKTESFEIFKYLKEVFNFSCYLTTLKIDIERSSKSQIKEYILENPNDENFNLLWRYCKYEDFNLDELASLLIYIEDSSSNETIDIWDRFIQDAEDMSIKQKLSNNYRNALITVCSFSKNEYVVSECWGLLKNLEFEFYEFEQLIMIDNEEIREHVYYECNFSWFSTEKLIEIINDVNHDEIVKMALNNLNFKDKSQDEILKIIKSTKNDTILKKAIKKYNAF